MTDNPKGGGGGADKADGRRGVGESDYELMKRKDLGWKV